MERKIILEEIEMFVVQENHANLQFFAIK